jgi:hypothetical protein
MPERYSTHLKFAQGWIMNLRECLTFLSIVFSCSIASAQSLQSASAQAVLWQGYGPSSLNDPASPVDRVSVEIGSIGLIREIPDDQVIAIDQNNQSILSANELQGGMQFGLKTTLDIRNVSYVWGGTDLQLGYFGINSMDAEETIQAAQARPVFFNGVPVNPTTSALMNYSSNLYSGETNLRFRSYSCLRPIAGLRYFKLEDNYDVSVLGANANRNNSNTNNSMFGGQFGLDGDLWITRRVTYYATGKLGLMHNRIEGAAEAVDSSQNALVANFKDSTFSTLVDTGVGARIRLAGPLSLNVGYQFLFASKLALGIDQNEAISLFTPGNAVALNSQQWHGLNTTFIWDF